MEKQSDPDIRELYQLEAKSLAEKAFVDVNTFKLPKTSKFDTPIHLIPESLMDKDGFVKNQELADEIHSMALLDLVRILKPPEEKHFSEKGRDLWSWSVFGGRAYLNHEVSEGRPLKTWLSDKQPKEFRVAGLLRKLVTKKPPADGGSANFK